MTRVLPDFGDLVFQRGELPPPAIVYLRMHPIVVGEVLSMALRALEAPLDACFVVVTHRGSRRRRFSR